MKEVFNRYEKKFIISQDTYELLLNKLKNLVVEDKYSNNSGTYQIANIYYDTSTDELIRNSIEKPVYKEKLRLRSYGIPDLEDKVFLEIKKKYKGIVNKRRISLPLYQAYEFIENGKVDVGPEVNKQIYNEIVYFLTQYNVAPKIYLAYDRKAFFGKEDHNLRITFDTNIRSRRDDLQLELGNYGVPLVSENQWLMEIKVDYAIPVWLTKIISDCNVYSTSFSKYGTEYKKQRGGQRCLNQFLQQQQMRDYQLAHQC